MSNEKREPGQSWYVAQLKPNGQKVAEVNLLRQGFEIFAPRHEEARRTRAGFRRQLCALFPGYLFVKARAGREDQRRINGTLGVARLLQFSNDGPASVPNALVDILRRRCDDEGHLKPAPLRAGDRVRLLGGPFADFVATIETTVPGQRAWLLLSLMGRIARTSASQADFVPV